MLAEPLWHSTARHGTAWGCSPWGTAQRRASVLPLVPAGRTREAHVTPEVGEAPGPPGAAPPRHPRGTLAPYPRGDDGAEVVGELSLQLCQGTAIVIDVPRVLAGDHAPELLPVCPLQAHRQHLDP